MNKFQLNLISCASFITSTLLCTPVMAYEAPRPFPSDGVVEDAKNQLPRLVTRVDAQYPADLVNRTLKDEIYVAFIVDKTGTTKKVRAFFSRHPELEKAAEDAVKQWKFTGGTHDGRPVSTQMIAKVAVEPDVKS